MQWMLMFYPGHQTSHARVHYASSEAQAKRWIAGWTRHHHGAIGKPPPRPLRTY